MIYSEEKNRGWYVVCEESDLLYKSLLKSWKSVSLFLSIKLTTEYLYKNTHTRFSSCVF